MGIIYYREPTLSRNYSKLMTIINASISFAKQRPILAGVLVVLAALAVGICIAFAVGLTNPTQTHADDFSGDSGFTNDSSGGGSLSDFSSGLSTSGSVDMGVSSFNDGLSGDSGFTNTPTIDTPSPTDVPPDSFLGAPCCTLPDTGTPVDVTVPVDVPPIYIPPVYIPPVIIPPPHVTPPTPPVCTLSASVNSLQIGSSGVLTWSTSNATSFKINGTSETPVSAGSTTVSPLVSTTYTGVATGPGGSVNCSAMITVTLLPPPPSTPECTLTATPTTINQGGYSTLSWTTSNATTFTIDQGIGSETLSGHTQVSPSTTTTYTGTATGPGGTVNCTTTIVVVPPPPPPPNAPACTLSTNPTYINQGGSSTITWTSSNTTSGSINNGIGNVAVSGSTSVSPSVTTTYTGTFIGTNGQTVNCQTTVVVNNPPPPPPPPGCTYSCGGGGGGQFISFQGVSGQIIQSPPVAAAYVSLSQIPYTGLDLGPVGTVVYWITLILICLAAAYLIIFNLVPLIYRRMTSFGSGVSQVLNQPSGLALAAGAGVVAGHEVSASHAPVAVSTTAPAYRSAYSIDQGFRSFAEGNTLTIDDIVKGLARETAVVAPVAAMAAPVMSSEDLVAPRPQTAVMYSAQPARATEPSAPVSTDVRDFVAALLNGDRTTVFSSYRQMIREGGDGETFLTQVVCAIDDAYRARVEGTDVHPEIAQLTANCATPFLEKITSALTNAVDSSYSPGVTGGKLALTRALAVVEG